MSYVLEIHFQGAEPLVFERADEFARDALVKSLSGPGPLFTEAPTDTEDSKHLTYSIVKSHVAYWKTGERSND
jgi:hypothetical protein